MSIDKRSRPIKRVRRTKAEVAELRQAMIDFCTQHHPLSVRSLYYLMSQDQLVPKKENGYRLVKDYSGKLRECGAIPFEWLKDESRQVIQVYTCTNLADGLHDLAAQYRRYMWTDQPRYVELWCEAKASIASLRPLTEKWQVRLVPVGGFSSKTFLWECAKYLARIEKPIHIVYVGDFDPSGLSIEVDIQTRLQRYAQGLQFDLKRVALTEQQVHDMGLPTRPPKPGDSRTKGFAAAGVAELEAIPPNQLRQMCSNAIASQIDHDIRLTTKAAERQDVEQLEDMMQ